MEPLNKLIAFSRSARASAHDLADAVLDTPGLPREITAKARKFKADCGEPVQRKTKAKGNRRAA